MSTCTTSIFTSQIKGPHLPNVPAPDLTPYVPRLLIDWQKDTPSVTAKMMDGTLAFVDLSGFTAMSEKLAKLGKLGAEETTQVLNSTFSDLLSVAYAQGGSLLKFGGDALLLFFDGEEHPARGAASALAMRRRLRDLGQLRTSAGSIRLKMSTGVHSGAFLFALAGTSHRELFVLGPGVTQTVKMETEAEAGEVLVSKDTASRIHGIETTPKGDGLLLSRIRKMPVAPQAPTKLARTDVSHFLSTAIRSHLLQGASDPEHRPVSVGFLNFTGIDGLLEKSGEQAVENALQELMANVLREIDDLQLTFLGTDVSADGGKIILTAGAPVVGEDDEERMLTGVTRICSKSLPLKVRFGVHRGHVFAGDVGPPYRRTYTVIGDAVNTAARVMAHAEFGTVLATRDVLKQTASRIKSTPAAAFHVKGKRLPIEAEVVEDVIATPIQADAPLPLMGRDAELKRLLQAVEAAGRGEGAVMEIVGEPGLGKSRLLQELWKTCSCMRISAVCKQYESMTPHFTTNNLLREAFSILHDASPEDVEEELRRRLTAINPDLEGWLPLVALPLGLTLPSTEEVDRLAPEFAQGRMHQLIEDLLRRWLPRPTVLVVDDAQWIDAASRQTLLHLLDAVPDHGWMICLATRPEGSFRAAGYGQVEEIRLEPLTQREAADLALEADASLLPGQADEVATRSGGNPLFVRELAVTLGASGEMENLPETVESLIASRIDVLARSDRTLLRVMSVLGQDFEIGLLEDMLSAATDLFPNPPDLNAKGTWRRLSSFLSVKEGRVHFHQALFQQAAYEGLAYSRRKTLHERVGVGLERRLGDSESQAEILSLHFDRAGNYAGSWLYSRTAARSAEKKFAHLSAATFYKRALEASRRIGIIVPEDVADAWAGLGLALQQTGAFSDAANAFRKARMLHPANDPLKVRMMRREGAALDRLGFHTRALRIFNRALRLADELPPTAERDAESARLALHVALIHRRRGRLQEAERIAQSAAEVAQARKDAVAAGSAFNVLNMIKSDLQESKLARSFGEKALEWFERADDLGQAATVLNNLGTDAYMAGEWDKAASLYRKSRESLEKVGNLLGAAAVASNLAEILSDQGRLDEAYSEFRQVLKTFKAARFPERTAAVISNLGRTAARAGNFEEGERLLREALSEFERLRTIGATTEVRLAELFVLRGDPEEATAILNRISEASLPLKPMILRLRGYAYLQRGRTEEARELFHQSVAVARKLDLVLDAALALEGLLRISRILGEEFEEDDPRPILEALGVVYSPAVPVPAI